MPDHEILNEMDALGGGIDLWLMLLDPHHLGDGIHLVGRQARDLRDVVSTQLLHEFRALLRPARVGVEHGVVQGLARAVGHDKGFTEAGDADARNIRVLFGHLFNDRVNALHHGGDVDLMPADLAAHRVVPVRLAELRAVFIEHRQLAAGGADIQSCDLHASFSKNFTSSALKGVRVA